MCLSAITDEFEADTINRLADSLVDKPANLNSAWLIHNGWEAVPVESAGHFNETQAELLSTAFNQSGHSQLFAITTEPLIHFASCFVVEASTNGLLKFSAKCAHFNFVVLPPDRSAAILCTVYDYFIVAGPREFVRRATGGDVEIARKKFDEVAADPWWEGRLQRVAERYRRPSQQS